jgi:hypothetical protein
MKEILETIITNLVNDTESVNVTEEITENAIELKVKVSKDDMGKVIGKQGRTANAIRILTKSFAGKENKKINVEFVEE